MAVVVHAHARVCRMQHCAHVTDCEQDVTKAQRARTASPIGIYSYCNHINKYLL